MNHSSLEPSAAAAGADAVLALLALRNCKPKEMGAVVAALRTRGPDFCALAAEQPALFPAPAATEAARDLMAWAKEGISCSVLGSGDYPERLTDLYDPPPIIFYRGDLAPLKAAPVRLGIVGARASDKMSESFAFNSALETSARGAFIVSGLALGIDSEAHRGAVSSGGRTIAVLGSGIKKIYPASNTALAREIIDRGGVILSEFAPDSPAYPSNFLQRNRIIAALSDFVLLVQAGERSGSLVTARFALELGREVLAAPGAFWDKRFLGSNKMIKDGASPVVRVEELFEFMPGLPEIAEKEEAAEDLSADAASVLALCGESGRIHLDDISRRLSPSRAGEALVELELNGRITRLPGNYIALNPK